MPLKQKLTANQCRAELANVEVGVVKTALTAAGTNQSTAYILTLDDVHVFTTVAGGTGGIFQVGQYAAGDWVTITNFGASTLSIYPATGGAIENGATNAPFTFGPNTSAYFQSIDGLNWIAGFLPGTGGGGLGTVTSVGFTGDGTVYNAVVPGSPVTTSGTFSPTLHTQSANTTLSGPTTGAAAAPTFRALVSADIPLATSSVTGAVKPDNTTITISAGIITAALRTAANPTATAGPAAVNGSAATYMRSDGAPAVQLGSSSQKGIVQVDNTTITAASGVISAVIPTNQKIAGITFIIDGGGSAITTGTKGYLQIPFGCTIQESTLLADQSGSIVVNLWKCTYSQFDAGSTHPVAGDKINSMTPPTISSATKADDVTLSGWTTTINAGDIIGYNVSSVTTLTRVTSTLKVSKT